MLNEHGDAQLFQHLLNLRGVQDHRGFDGQRTAHAHQQLVVRRAVLAGVEHVPPRHGGGGVFDIPAVGLGAGQGNGIQPVHRVEQGHGRRGRKIDVFQRLSYDFDVPVQPAGHIAALGHHQVAVAVADGQQLVAALVIIHGELVGVFQRHFRLPGQPRQFLLPVIQRDGGPLRVHVVLIPRGILGRGLAHPNVDRIFDVVGLGHGCGGAHDGHVRVHHCGNDEHRGLPLVGGGVRRAIHRHRGIVRAGEHQPGRHRAIFHRDHRAADGHLAGAAGEGEAVRGVFPLRNRGRLSQRPHSRQRQAKHQRQQAKDHMLHDIAPPCCV